MRYAFLFIAALFVSSALEAQVSVRLNMNLGSQPAWGPSGYEYVEYYYLPDIETYYNVSNRRFYYFEGGRWIGRSELPGRYRNYDFYNSYKIVVNEREPYRDHAKYRDLYSTYRGRHDQRMNRDKHDSKYVANPHRPDHQIGAPARGHGKRNGGGDRDEHGKEHR